MPTIIMPGVINLPEDIITDAEEPMTDEQEVDIMTEHDCSGLELADRLPVANRFPVDLRLSDLEFTILNVLNNFVLTYFSPISFIYYIYNTK